MELGEQPLVVVVVAISDVEGLGVDVVVGVIGVVGGGGTASVSVWLKLEKVLLVVNAG